MLSSQPVRAPSSWPDVLERAPQEDRVHRPVSLVDLLQDMLPLLDRALGVGRPFRIDLCRTLPPVDCHPVAFEGAVLGLVLHVRQSLRARSAVRLSAVCRAAGDRPGIRLEVAITLPRLRILSASPIGAADTRHWADAIGLATTRRFAEALGGWLERDCSIPGRLTTALWLPCLT